MIKILLGDDSYAIAQRINQLKADILDPNWEAFNLQHTNTLKEAIRESMQFPLGCGGKLIILNNYQPLKEDSELDLDVIPNETTLIIIANNLDGRLKITKQLKKLSIIENFPLPKPWEIEKLKERTRELAKNRVKLSKDSGNILIESVGVDLARLDSEIEKLSIYQEGKAELLAPEVVSILVEDNQASVFALADAIRLRNNELALKLLDKLEVSGAYPLEISGALQYKFREWFKVKIGIAKLHPYRQKILTQEVANISKGALVRCYCEISKYHEDFKTGNSKSLWQLIIELLEISAGNYLKIKNNQYSQIAVNTDFTTPENIVSTIMKNIDLISSQDSDLAKAENEENTINYKSYKPKVKQAKAIKANAQELTITAEKINNDNELNQPNYPDFKYCITTEDAKLQLQKILDYHYEILGFDTETTGLNPHQHKIRLIQIAPPNQPVIIIDCFQVILAELPELKQILQDEKLIKCFQNAKFDLKFLRSNGIKVKGNLFDTEVAEHLLMNGLTHKATLKDLASKYLKIDLSKVEQLSNWEAPQLTEKQLKYAALDASILLDLREKLKPELINSRLSKIAKIEFDCIHATAELEYNGLLLDLAKWQEYTKTLEIKQKEAELKAKSLLKTKKSQLTLIDLDIDLNSPKQVLETLQSLGINITSTNENIIAPLAPQYPAISALLEYRHYNKLLSAFGKPLPQKINPVTGRIHATFWQITTRAGRYSNSDPNLQQLPRIFEVRSCFIPAPGYKFVIADYSQIELRIAAELAQETKMIQAYKEGLDLHKLTASFVLEKPLEAVTKQDRQTAKASNFGLLYGQGAEGFKNYAEGSYGVKLSLASATKIRERFFKAYPGLVTWHQKIKTEMYRSFRISKLAEVRTLSGRRRLFTEPKFTEFVNTPDQGTGADILKLALGNLIKKLEGTKIKLVHVVHDEIILEAPEEKAEEAGKILREVMEEAGAEFIKSVPIIASASFGNSWADKA